MSHDDDSGATWPTEQQVAAELLIETANTPVVGDLPRIIGFVNAAVANHTR